MNRKELIEHIHAVLGTSKSDVESVLEYFCKVLTYELKAGGVVPLGDLGRFEVVERKARTARNPATGEPIHIPAKRVPKFTPSRRLKKAVAD